MIDVAITIHKKDYEHMIFELKAAAQNIDIKAIDDEMTIEETLKRMKNAHKYINSVLKQLGE